MLELLRGLDDVSRRAFVSYTARAFLGVGLAPVFGASPVLARPRSKRLRTKNVIYLYMSGGMSHLDTFDTKPGSDVQGPGQTIKTNADGVLISEYLPLLAEQMDKVAIIRSMHSTQGAHSQGRYFMHTSYTAKGTIQHPSLGSWVLKLSGRTNEDLPGNILIGAANDVNGGFFESKYDPLVIGDPGEGLQNAKRSEDVTKREFTRRLSLAQRFDRAFRKRYDQRHVRAYADMYDDAIRLMTSKDLKAFDVNEESATVREAYGRGAFGQGCLLARRLVEHDVRFVEVLLDGWDTHLDNFEEVPHRAATLDQALSALLADLSSKGMLDHTVVVLATEFGRTPRINENNGRDHHNQAFSCLLAGAGIKGGQAYGQTDSRGGKIEENKVTVPDFHASIAHAIGLPLDEVVRSPSGRPFTVAHKGKSITALF